MVMCGWVQNRIPAYLAGELAPRPAKWLLWHIRQCHVCRKAMEVLKSIQTLVAQALTTDVQAPDSLSPRVMAAIDALPPSHAPPPEGKRPWFRWRR